MNYQAAIGVYIRQQGLMKSAVAERAGITLPRFSQILNSKTPLKMDEFLSVCNALNVKPSEFIKTLDKIRTEVKI